MTSDRKPAASPDFRASNSLLCMRMAGGHQHRSTQLAWWASPAHQTVHVTTGHLDYVLPEQTCCSMQLAGCVRIALHIKNKFCPVNFVAHRGAESNERLTVLAIFANTLSWKDVRACRLSSWLLPPADIALATTPAHCSVPCVATGRSTLLSATAATANRARSGATTRDLRGINEDLGLRSCGRAFERTTQEGRIAVDLGFSEHIVGGFDIVRPPLRHSISAREALDLGTWDPCDPFLMSPRWTHFLPVTATLTVKIRATESPRYA